jgi:hypothetical protein
LAENGQELSSPPAWADIPKGSCAVCCVDNGPFQAVAVAYNPKELQFFQSEPEDTRPKTWFFLEKTLAVKYSTVEMDDFA